MEIIIGIVSGVGVFIITYIISAIIRKAEFETRNDRLQKAIEELQQENKVILKVLLPLVLSVKGQKPNGELTRALELLDEYLINK